MDSLEVQQRTTRCNHQRVTRANKPYQQFVEEQNQKRQRMKAKQQTTAADKISHRTLIKLLREQATANAQTQTLEQQRRICSEGDRCCNITNTNKNKPIKITQDEDDNDDTLAPTTLDLPTDDWDDGEDEEVTPPQPRRSPRLNRMNFMCQSLASVSQQALHTFTASAFLQELQWTMDNGH